MGISGQTATDTGSRFGPLIWFNLEYTFSPSGHVVQETAQYSSQAEADAAAVARAPGIEASVIDSDNIRASHLVADPPPGTVQENVTPDFPDELPESDPDVSVDTRRRRFHRWLLRWVWPQDLLTVERYWLPVWLWVDQLSAPNARTYLNVDVPTFNSISQRMGVALTISDAFDADTPGEIP